MTDVKKLVIEAFEIMLSEYTAQNNRWKCKAYKTALNSIKDVDKIVTLDDIKGLKGFGKSLTLHVKEIIDTHQMKNAKPSEFSKDVKTLMSIHGVGVQNARKFVSLGVHTVDDLQTAYTSGKIKLTDAQILGLKYYDDMHLRIPYREMKQHEEFMLNEIQKFSKTAKLNVVGSFRRRMKDSGDIDVLITDEPHNPKLFSDFLGWMEDCNYFFGTLAKGTVKYNGFCRIPGKNNGLHARRVDVLYTKPEEYAFALLYFTGSGEFNKEMRAYALKKGYSLNQMNIIDTSSKTIVKSQSFKTEKDIFDFLGIKYVEPRKRLSGNVIPRI